MCSVEPRIRRIAVTNVVSSTLALGVLSGILFFFVLPQASRLRHASGYLGTCTVIAGLTVTFLAWYAHCQADEARRFFARRYLHVTLFAYLALAVVTLTLIAIDVFGSLPGLSIGLVGLIGAGLLALWRVAINLTILAVHSPPGQAATVSIGKSTLPQSVCPWVGLIALLICLLLLSHGLHWAGGLRFVVHLIAVSFGIPALWAALRRARLPSGAQPSHPPPWPLLCLMCCLTVVVILSMFATVHAVRHQAYELMTAGSFASGLGAVGILALLRAWMSRKE